MKNQANFLKLTFMVALAAVMLLGRSGFAQKTKPAPEAVKPFVPVFQTYVASYIGRQGDKGLRQVVTPDFIWYTGADHKAIRGEEAIRQAAKELGFSEALPKEKGVTHSRSLSIQCSAPQLDSTGTSATIYTQLNYGFIVAEATTAKGGTAIGLYKQIWRKTPQGWRLAAMELDSRPDAISNAPDSYVVVAQGDEANPISKKKN